MKFTVFDLNNREIVSDRDDVTLQLSQDQHGVLRWQVIDNGTREVVVASACPHYRIEINFYFTKGVR